MDGPENPERSLPLPSEAGLGGNAASPPGQPPTNISPPPPDSDSDPLAGLKRYFGEVLRGEIFPQLARSQHEQIEGALADLATNQQARIQEIRGALQSSLDGAIASLSQQIQPLLVLTERVAGIEARIAQAGQAEQRKFSSELITEQFPDVKDGFLKVKKIL